jgi:alkaline phosphatase D
MPLTRRSLLELFTSSTFYLTLAPRSAIAAALPDDATPLEFPQGVASGDPQPDGVMLWTRAIAPGGANGPVSLLLELGSDPEFSTPLLQEKVHTDADSDYTVRTYIDGLTPDTWYYYRFLGADGSASRTGRTRTAPAPGQARKVKLAFVSCQNYEQAFYGSWARMLADDRNAPEPDRIQFVLHLGDFIYERCWRERLQGGPPSRHVPPFPDGVETAKHRDAVSLADYRHLYKTYLSDPYLQAARANWPFICTWDDHEFVDDNFQSFSTDGGSARLEAQRKLDANQAWFEFIPAVLDELANQPAHNFRPRELGPDERTHNEAAVDSLRIYRKLGWGQYLDIVLTDSRSYRTPPCLPPDFAASLGLPLNTVRLVEIADAGTEYAGGNPPATLPWGDGTVANPARERPPGSMLGPGQRTWFIESLRASTASWKIWANALPLLPMRLDMSSLPFTDYEDSVFNIDGWAGYPHEVGTLMRLLEAAGIAGVVSLSGDHHMHGAGTVQSSTTDSQAKPVAVDFTVAAVSSSPIFEDLVAAADADHSNFATLVYRETEAGVEPTWNITMVQGVLAAYAYAKTGLQAATGWLGPNNANPGLGFVDTTINGYGLASVDGEEMQVLLVAMQDCRAAFEQPPAIAYTARFRLPLWRAGEAPQLAGPQFDGRPPFPFETPPV